MIHLSHTFSPIRYDQLSPDQLALMLAVTALLTAVMATATAVSWRRLARPRPPLLSYAGVCHLLLFSSTTVCSVACLVGAAELYASR